MAEAWSFQFKSSNRPSLGGHYKLCPVCGRYLVGIRAHMEVDHPDWVAALAGSTVRARVAPLQPAESEAPFKQASATALASEEIRAQALAKHYGGRSELLTLAEASALHPDLVITQADLDDSRNFHLRFRKCSICGRFPARALIHLAEHESGRLDAEGHVTDPARRRAIDARAAKVSGGGRAAVVPVKRAVASTNRDWSERENVILVDAYLDLLAAELRGEQRVKRDINRSLQTRLDARNHASIEFKMQNVSAVLFDEGLPWVEGYKPAANYQRALRPIVVSILDGPRDGRAQIEVARTAVPMSTTPSARPADLETAPPPATPRRAKAKPGTRVTRAWKGAVADAANMRLGRAGEEWVCAIERRRLLDAGRPDLAERIDWVADTEGDGLGYDVKSFDEVGSELWIEVKTTNSGKSAPFLLTPNELAVWRKDARRYRLFRVYSFVGDPHFYQLRGAPSRLLTLTTALWDARLK